MEFLGYQIPWFLMWAFGLAVLFFIPWGKIFGDGKRKRDDEEESEEDDSDTDETEDEEVEEEDDDEEPEEPERECAFQQNWQNEDDEGESCSEWCCGLASDSDKFCDKSICPLWKGKEPSELEGVKSKKR